MIRPVLFVVAAILSARSVLAQGQFEAGDVVVAANSSRGSAVAGKVLWYDVTGHLKGVLYETDAGPVEGLAFTPTGTLLLALGASGIDKLSAAGPPGVYYVRATSDGPASLAVAGDGTVYTGTGFFGVFAVLRIDSAGSLRNRYALTAPAQALALAYDQCTLHYLTLNKLSKLDVCHDALLPDTASFGGPGAVVSDMRLLSDGSFLVAKGYELVKVSPAGSVIRTYAFQARHFALDPSGMAVWASKATTPGVFGKTELDTGQVIVGPIDTGMDTIVSVAVMGEPSQATAAAIPALSREALVLLAIMLTAFGAWFVRHHSP